MEKLYITTAIPYVNAEPHLGFAVEVIQADVVARFRRAEGSDVRFLAGTDDNALKNVLAADEAGTPVKDFVAAHARRFRDLKELLNLSYDDFISTSEERHFRGAQKFWRACKADDIYRKAYEGLYCVGCEEFKMEKELRDGRCPEHPTTTLEEIKEENYFFRLSRYAPELLELISSDALRIVPEGRKREMLAFIEGGLEDFSISRSVGRARGWGVPVPGDASQVMYVWFDALTNYINALGYADDAPLFQRFWQEDDAILHMVGKGISRFHAIYWPAMLLSAGLRLPREIFVHGYLTIEGKKISKSLGNGVHPKTLVDRYGVDAVRYFLLREISAYEDGDFSTEKFEERYNADLANGLGNFTARVLALAEKASANLKVRLPLAAVVQDVNAVDKAVGKKVEEARRAISEKMEEFKFNEALQAIWSLISFGDVYINEKQPWKIPQSRPTDKVQVIGSLLFILKNLEDFLKPFLPETSGRVAQSITVRNGRLDIKKIAPLFPRLSI